MDIADSRCPSECREGREPYVHARAMEVVCVLLPVPILGATLRHPLTPFVRFGHIPLGYRSIGSGPRGQRAACVG